MQLPELPELIAKVSDTFAELSDTFEKKSSLLKHKIIISKLPVCPPYISEQEFILFLQGVI